MAKHLMRTEERVIVSHELECEDPDDLTDEEGEAAGENFDRAKDKGDGYTFWDTEHDEDCPCFKKGL